MVLPQRRVTVDVTVNGTPYRASVEARMLLVRLLRDELGVMPEAFGCDSHLCGSCGVRLDGVRVKSCTVLAVQADGHEITVEEAVDGPDLATPSGAADHGLRCGFCTPAMLAASAERHPASAPCALEDLCRCPGSEVVADAVRWASEESSIGTSR
ncbi:MAG: (2Fe-2S)-binding protein [Microthrixaceae bacterium]|jgi:carbon-monoxide dehydrogenase small subunit|nr:(2Fe-2S)-binding protein [Microthrixaceae bacterium]HMT23717.1 (2Fe-2S)-binding protein [Microthrixaceae bacterium]HMT60977.1 (2Fe-2S)-binding protein [Microthrixaceae bacterium]